MYRCRLRWCWRCSWSQLFVTEAPSSGSSRPSSNAVALEASTSAAAQRKDASRFGGSFSFRSVTTEKELCSVLANIGEGLSGQSVAAAFRRLVQFGGRPQEETLSFMTEKALQHTSSMSAEDAISLLTSSRQLPILPWPLREAVLQRIVDRECLLQLNGKLMAECLTSLASLQQEKAFHSTEDSDVKAQFSVMRELSRLFVAPGFAANLPTAELVQITCGFGRLRFQNPAVHEVICKEVEKLSRLESMRYGHLVSVWRALASLQVTNLRALTIVSDEIVRPERLQGFKTPELVSLLTASKQILPFRRWAFLQKLIGEMTKLDRLSSYTEAHIAHIVHALCGLRVQGGALHVFLEEATKDRRLPYFTKQGMLSMLCALKSRGYGTHPKIRFLMEKAQDLAQDEQDCLSEQELLSFIFGKCCSEAEEELCNKMFEQLMNPEKLQTLSDAALAGILPGMCQRGMNGEAQLNLCTQEIIQRLQRATPEILSFYAYGFRVNNIRAERFLAPFATEVVKEERLSKFKAHQLAGIFYSLARLGWKDLSTFQSLLTVIACPQNLDQCSELGLVNIITAIQLSRVPLTTSVEKIIDEATQSHRLLHSSERSLISLITSFGRMRLRSQHWTLPMFEEITKIGRLVRLTNEELAELLYVIPGLRKKTAQGMDRIKAETLKPHRLNQMDPHQLSRVVYGMGALRMREEDVYQKVQERLSSGVDISSLPNSALSNLVYGIGSMACHDKDLCSMILPEATQAGRLAEYSPSELTNLIIGMEAVHEADPSSALRLTEAFSRADRLASLSHQQRTLIFVSVARILSSVDDPPSFPDALLSTVTDPEELSRFQSHQLIHLCSVLECGILHRAPLLSLVSALSDEVQKPERLTSTAPSELTTLSRAFSKAGFKDDPVVKSIAEELMHRFLEKAEKQRDQGEN